MISFFDLNQFLDCDGFVVWNYMHYQGWFILNFDALKRTAYVDFQQGGCLKHDNSNQFRSGHDMAGTIKVHQFDIMGINRSEQHGNKFSARISFSSEATKLIIQNCPEETTMSKKDRFIRWMKCLLVFVSKIYRILENPSSWNDEAIQKRNAIVWDFLHYRNNYFFAALFKVYVFYTLMYDILSPIINYVYNI